MADCGDSDYQKIPLANQFDLDKAKLFKATIVTIDSTNNCAELSYTGTCPEVSSLDLTAVDFWYHCEYSTGTLEDLADGHKAFSDDDEVYVLFVPENGDVGDRLYIVGHVDIHGTETCAATEYLWMYCYIPSTAFYDVIFDLGAGKIMDIDAFVSLPDSPPKPATNPSQRSQAWFDWFWYNFEYSDEDISVPLNTVKRAPISEGDDTITAWDYNNVVVSSVSSPDPPHTGIYQEYIKQYKEDSDTYQFREIQQSEDDNNDLSGTCEQITRYSKDYGFGYDLWDTEAGTLAKKLTISFQETFTRTRNYIPYPLEVPHQWVHQNYVYDFDVNVLGAYSYNLDESYDFYFDITSTGVDEFNQRGMFPEYQGGMGNSANLWTEKESIGEKYYIWIGGVWQGLNVYDINNCPSCKTPECWVWSHFLYEDYGVLDWHIMLRDPLNCSGTYGDPVKRYIVSPAAIVVPYANIPDLVLDADVDVATLFDSADVNKSKALSKCISDFIDTIVTIWPFPAANVPKIGLGNARLCKRLDESAP